MCRYLLTLDLKHYTDENTKCTELFHDLLSKSNRLRFLYALVGRKSIIHLILHGGKFVIVIRKMQLKEFLRLRFILSLAELLSNIKGMGMNYDFWEDLF